MVVLVCNKEDGNMVEMYLTADQYRIFEALQNPTLRAVLLEYLEKLEEPSASDQKEPECET